jgi:hypothetical protein
MLDELSSDEFQQEASKSNPKEALKLNELPGDVTLHS